MKAVFKGYYNFLCWLLVLITRQKHWICINMDVESIRHQLSFSLEI